MMEMVRHEYIGNLQHVSTEVHEGRCNPNGNVHRSRCCCVRAQTLQGNIARSKLTMEAIRSMHADFYNLPDDTRYNASANSSNKIKILEEEVTIDDCEQSLQTISPILSSEGTVTQCINQKAHLMSEQNQLSPDWVAGLEGESVFCEVVTIR